MCIRTKREEQKGSAREWSPYVVVAAYSTDRPYLQINRLTSVASRCAAYQIEYVIKMGVASSVDQEMGSLPKNAKGRVAGGRNEVLLGSLVAGRWVGRTDLSTGWSLRGNGSTSASSKSTSSVLLWVTWVPTLADGQRRLAVCCRMSPSSPMWTCVR